jgi:hypothetical protein
MLGSTYILFLRDECNAAAVRTLVEVLVNLNCDHIEGDERLQTALSATLYHIINYKKDMEGAK